MDSLPQQLRELLGDLANEDILQTVGEISRQMDGYFQEGGSISDWISDQIAGSERPGSPLTEKPINVIPGVSRLHCHPLLVAFSSGGKGTNGLPKILEAVKTHLASCAGVTRVALIYTDYWDAKMYDSDHRATLEALAGRGTGIVYILVPWKGSRPTRIGHYCP